MLNICFDCDDVLNSLMQNYLDWMYMTDEYKGPKISYEQIVQNPPHDILGISELKYRQTLHKFRFMMYHTLQPNQEILNWFYQYGEKAHFSVLTSAFRDCIPITTKWIFENFSQWVRTFAFVPSKVSNDDINIIYDNNKADWLVRNHVDIFIDDSLKNIFQVKARSDNKIDCYLVKQPWNDGMEIGNVLKELNKWIDWNEKDQKVKGKS